MQYSHLAFIQKPVARLVQGAVMVSPARLAESFALLDDIYALGGNTFDTAHGYGNGDSERALGRWVNARGVRDQVVIIDKGAHHNQDRKRVTPFDITADLFDSLARLQVDSIDLYLLHRDDPTVPVGPIIEVLNEHQQAGRITAFGASNWSLERLLAANTYATERGLSPFQVSSPNFSLAEQRQPPWPDCITISGPEHETVRAWYQASQMPLFAWSSLAGGFFSGRFRPDNLHTFTDYFDRLCVESYCTEANFRRLERAEALAEAEGLTLPQIALAYVLSQPLNIFALVGCRSGAEFADNVAALALTLTAEELAWLDLKHDRESGKL